MEQVKVQLQKIGNQASSTSIKRASGDIAPIRIEDTMATSQQSSPLLSRSGTSLKHGPIAVGPPAFANRGPYLVNLPDGKGARVAQRYPALFPHEPEDARITGTTRSLYRRLLALNLPGRVSSPSAVSASATEVAKSLSTGFKIA